MDANIYIYRGNKFRAKGSQARPGSSCCSRAMGHAVLGPERGGRKKSGRKARMARFPRRAAAILLRPANQEAGNAETTLRVTEAPPPQRSTLDHGSIACRNHPFDAPGKASPSSRGEAEKGSKRARARVHPRTTTFSVSLKTASFSIILRIVILEFQSRIFVSQDIFLFFSDRLLAFHAKWF